MTNSLLLSQPLLVQSREFVHSRQSSVVLQQVCESFVEHIPWMSVVLPTSTIRPSIRLQSMMRSFVWILPVGEWILIFVLVIVNSVELSNHAI